MKSIVLLFTLAQIYGVFCTNISHKGKRLSVDYSNPQRFLVARDTYQTLLDIYLAVNDAIGNVTVWTSNDPKTRSELLNELEIFKTELRQSMSEITQAFLDGSITTQYRLLLSNLNHFLGIHLNRLNPLITVLVPTIKDFTGTHAITSCLDVVQLVEKAMKINNQLISSS